MSGLRKLAAFSMNDGKEAYKATMEKYSKNYIATFLKIYRLDSEFSVNAMATLKEFVKLASHEKLIEFYNSKF